jgi:hypothetical protein
MTIVANRALEWNGEVLLYRGREYACLVPDDKYPNMWRVRTRDGVLSDMTNRTRAREGARLAVLAALNGKETPLGRPRNAQNARTAYPLARNCTSERCNCEVRRMSSLSDRLVELKKRASEISKQLTSLADRRKSFAFAAVTGDKRAVREITDVDTEVATLDKESATVNSAIETGEALIAQQALDAETAARRLREGEAYSHARALIALNEELDLALIALREQFERRASLLAGLAATQVVDAGLIMRLSHKSNATSSAHRAGLGRFLAMEMTPVVAQRPLADSASLLLGIGSPPTNPRVRLN